MNKTKEQIKLVGQSSQIQGLKEVISAAANGLHVNRSQVVLVVGENGLGQDSRPCTVVHCDITSNDGLSLETGLAPDSPITRLTVIQGGGPATPPNGARHGSVTPLNSPSPLLVEKGLSAARKEMDEKYVGEILVQSLTREEGNVSAVARTLKIDRANLLRLLKRFNIAPDSFRHKKAA